MEEQDVSKAKWYVVKVHSGFERPVKFSIEQAARSLNLEDRIFEILIPVEKQVRIKGGKRTEKEERIYPGYILVHMIIDDASWYAINNIEHVSGFLGSRTYAEAISDDEVATIKRRMQGSNTTPQVDFAVGDTVRITEGPFADTDGKISEVDSVKGQVTVLVPMFGRETPVRLDLFQVRLV